MSNYDYCLSDKDKRCVDRVEDNFTLAEFIDNNCQRLCPAECVQSVFQMTITQYKYPYSEAYVNTTLRNKQQLLDRYANQSDFQLRLAENVAEFSVNYDSLSYIEIMEEPKMSWEDLVGYLGGLLHLFLGMSLLSFVELIEWVGLVAIKLIVFAVKSKPSANNEHTKSCNTKSHQNKTLSSI